jgi:hypothetical protein
MYIHQLENVNVMRVLYVYIYMYIRTSDVNPRIYILASDGAEGSDAEHNVHYLWIGEALSARTRMMMKRCCADTPQESQ